MDRRLIINADDFGLCEAVNSAVAQAYREGVLRSATIMANMPAAEDAVKIAKEMPGLGVGVHLNLSEAAPLSKDESVRSLVNHAGGFAFSPYVLSALSMGVHRIRNAIRAELAAQIQWVIDRGIVPTHLDSHKHIHCFPAIFTIVCDLARRFKIGAVRWAFEPRQVLTVPWPLSEKRAKRKVGLIRTMARINRLQQPFFLKTDCLLGVVHTGRIDVNFFRAVSLYNTAAVAEVMTHPGFSDGLDPAKTRLGRQRKTELEALCDERTRRYLKEAGIKLVHYGQLRPV